MKFVKYFTDKRTFALVLLNIIVVALYWFLFSNIQWVQKESSELLSISETDLGQEETFRSIEGIIQGSSTQLQQIESYFVSSRGVVDFIESIEKLADISGVIVTIDFLGVENVSGIVSETPIQMHETLRLKIVTEGRWTDTMHFLALLEYVPYKVSVGRTSLVFIPQSETTLSFSSSGRSPNCVWRGSFDFTVLKTKEYEES